MQWILSEKHNHFANTEGELQAEIIKGEQQQPEKMPHILSQPQHSHMIEEQLEEAVEWKGTAAAGHPGVPGGRAGEGARSV